MNKKTLRRLSVLLCLALVLAMLPVTAMAADTKFIHFNDGGASLWGQGGAWYAAWVWGGGVEGQWATATYSEGEGIYFFEVPAAATSIKFLRMASGATEPNWTKGDTGWWNQTSDLTIDGDYYTITGWGGTDGKWSIYGGITPEETTQDTEPAETVYYLRGTMNSWGTTTPLTNNGDGTYSVTVDLEAGTYNYKVGTSDWSFGCPANDATLVVDAAGAFTFTLNVEAYTVEVTGEGIGEPDPMVIDNIYVAGDEALCGSNWSTNDLNNQMIEVDGVYTKTYLNVAAGTYYFKFAANGTWDIQWSCGVAMESGTSYDAGFKNQGNSSFTVAEDGSAVTVTLDLSAANMVDGSGAKCSVEVVAPAKAAEVVLGDNVDCGLGSYTFTATQAGVLTVNVTALSYYDEYSGEWGTVNPNMAFGMQYTLLVNGITNYTPANSVNVKVGDVVTIELQSRMGAETKATINLSIEDYKVKYQVTQGADATAESVNVRFLTSVDSLDYQSVKFTFTVGDQSSEQVCTTVYESLLADGVTIDDASTVFGEGAKYFVAFTVTGVSDYETPIEVTVTWTALDGTETTATRTIVIADALA